MASLSAAFQRPVVRLMGRQILAADTAERSRAVIDRWSRLFMPPGGVQINSAPVGGVPAVHVTPSELRHGGALLVLHGGGYIFGSAHGYRAHGARLAKSVGAFGYVLDYRLAPEHPYPAAVDDALAAYDSLLASHPPGKIAFVGDSAGAGLSIATMYRARDAGLPMPACAVLFCPWFDLTLSGESMQSNDTSELLVPQVVLSRMADAYSGTTDRTDPGISPLFGTQDGLPPLLMQASRTESLFSDAERFAPKAKSAGVDVTFDISPDMWHDWQLMAPLVRESRQAMGQAAQFISQHFDG